jgi:hypothetical protein
MSCHAEQRGEVEDSAAKEILHRVYAERGEVLRITSVI